VKKPGGGSMASAKKGEEEKRSAARKSCGAWLWRSGGEVNGKREANKSGMKSLIVVKALLANEIHLLC